MAAVISRVNEAPRSRDYVTVFVVAGAFVGLLPPKIVADAYSSLEISLATLAIAATTVIGSRGVSWSRFSLPAPLLLLLVVMSGSVIWSTATLNTARDVGAFLCLVAAAWLLVQRARPAALVAGIVLAGMVIAGASLVAYVVDPVAATQQSSGALEGIYANRNQLGFVMLQCFTAALAINTPSRRWIAGKLCVAGLFFAVIVASFSKTSLIAAIVVAIAWLLIVALAYSRRYVWIVGGVFAAAIGVAVLNSTVILDFLGKDETLNGRAEIWTALINAMGSSPLLGFGFLQEWPGWSAQSQAVAAQMDGLQVVHAHNELLSWWSGTGVVGVAAAVLLYAFVYWAGWKVLRSSPLASAAWPFLVIVMLNVHGLTSLSETKPQGWFVFMIVVFLCAEAWRADPSLPKFVVLRLSSSAPVSSVHERSSE